MCCYKTTGNTIMNDRKEINNQKFYTGATVILALKENKIYAIVFDKESCKNFAKYNNDIKLV
ncbi:hypothetical protein [Brachyspira sp.]|uniref:hypothetical protein n=1 Tax=Brachyspira sp. TaxID=1977261 RepID=UPI002632CB28|nr:hypothetical protein [Brachyspira sp.]